MHTRMPGPQIDMNSGGGNGLEGYAEFKFNPDILAGSLYDLFKQREQSREGLAGLEYDNNFKKLIIKAIFDNLNSKFLLPNKESIDPKQEANLREFILLFLNQIIDIDYESEPKFDRSQVKNPEEFIQIRNQIDIEKRKVRARNVILAEEKYEMLVTLIKESSEKLGIKSTQARSFLKKFSKHIYNIINLVDIFMKYGPTSPIFNSLKFENDSDKHLVLYSNSESVNLLRKFFSEKEVTTGHAVANVISLGILNRISRTLRIFD